MTIREALRQWLIGLLIPATRPYDPWAEQREWMRQQAQWQRDQQQYYDRRAEDARMRYLMNPHSQQAPPTDWYR